MTVLARPIDDCPPHRDERTPPARQGTLWIDGCGGFLVLTEPRVTIGRSDWQGSRCQAFGRAGSEARIDVVADLPRRAGQLVRTPAGYAWQPSGAGEETVLAPCEEAGGGPTCLPINDISLQLMVFSKVDQTALVTIAPPHRLADHVDAVVLVDQVLTIGPTKQHPIRHPGLTDWYVLQPPPPAGQWRLRRPRDGHTTTVQAGRRVILDELSLMIQSAEE